MPDLQAWMVGPNRRDQLIALFPNLRRVGVFISESLNRRNLLYPSPSLAPGCHLSAEETGQPIGDKCTLALP